jgi:PAS domain S-box-containing protein
LPHSRCRAPALGVQIAQAVALARRMTDLRDSEQRYRRLVDELRATEDQRQKHLQLLRAVIDGTTDAIYVKDLEGRYLLMNTGAAAMIGRVPEQVIGQTDVDIFGVEASRALKAEDRLTIAAGETRTLEETIPFGEGKVVTFLSTKGVFRDQDGNVAGVFGISKDLTRYRELESRLQQAQKMEAIGRLAGGIAHDFNNMLSAIMSYADLLREDLPEGDSRREDVQEISRAAVRAAGLTRQLLAFSRQQVMEIRVLNLNDVVAAVDKMLRRIIGEDVNLDTKLVADLGSIKADPGQLEQVIMNLAVNARDAMPQGGKVTIRTANADLDETYGREHFHFQPGRYVILSFSDTGCGMDKETVARIFEPFFTTKEPGKGTGLGLSTVYGIVKQNGGYISAYSEPGQGTTFKIYLPQAEGMVGSAPAAATAEILPRGSETILLVEDEEALRTLARNCLESQGYCVLEAADGKAAMATAEKHSGPIELLLTDVIMPGMNGRHLADRLTELRPAIKVLYLSGYASDLIAQYGVLDPEILLLEKPFTLRALLLKVQQALGTSAKARAVGAS